MKTSTSERKRGIQWISKMQLDDLDFADDLTLLSQTQQQMKEKMNSVAAAVGLNIHKVKSKILRYNTACTNLVTIDGDLEDVNALHIWAASLTNRVDLMQMWRRGLAKQKQHTYS
ncbi:unnamed protein product [Schistosoma curassoni]|uniref:Reverse transcriptase domain-containing protein n=1 Tax=Schistosoma curassoni TaxID=6186 RepID=A0A183JRC6_9TREM|nr:unnamed protein product [Schistosoma curassoni]